MALCERTSPGTLCVVCEDIATGNHYSVPSCNGCKTFFRRAVVNNRTFTCMGNGDCPVNKAIQNDRDRIGYTKRTRKSEKNSSDPVIDSHE
ncbi:unnamed protein product [Nippostrongylus brasiliensis]|uniref:Nuclear hormone receptor family member nhr-47 (inferred by orthology to a C. elegans protein) n=1 Tax=Nippostrongylus brasiliensis TaxID=27835 RepID=A0A0N4XED4_NIPBR|nr:unnamed protein product [Nippostrongylus brasiliensis]